ncbi:putative L-type lectin-domain containing receptor kinase I.11 [Camellia lanceoleosa]|uniref:L-type lectin-domain containing receptor kinase I.11 n=1 Tax=Camellia lanceoleosa TaxID=1840588 RepID=A0ACC0HPS5_9ERIC|nr:putative L-type lectin-domain containing receptor kinase I.11 [Camellia lanceoleosa]
MPTTTLSVSFLILLHLYLKFMALAEDENQFIYNGFHGANLHLDGDAQIHRNGLLQLTNTSVRQSGHAFYPLPIRFNASSSRLPQGLSFSTNFIFAMVYEIENYSGHGIAFTISPSTNFTKASPAQFLGLLNSNNNGNTSNHLLAIELDTVNTTEFNDINDNHVGIDVNSLESIVSAPASYYSNSEGKNESLELASGDPMQVWIDYDEVENLLNVTLAPIQSQKPNQPLLSTHINLSSILLDSMYVGFSSATGMFRGLPEEIILVDWVFEKWKQGSILETSDPRLGRDYLEEEMLLVLKLGMLCSQYNEAARPSMRQVMQYLDGNVLLPDIPLHTTGMGAFSVTNEPSSEFVASFPSSVSKSSVQLMSITESILNSGR